MCFEKKIHRVINVNFPSPVANSRPTVITYSGGGEDTPTPTMSNVKNYLLDVRAMSIINIQTVLDGNQC